MPSSLIRVFISAWNGFTIENSYDTSIVPSHEITISVLDLIHDILLVDSNANKNMAEAKDSGASEKSMMKPIIHSSMIWKPLTEEGKPQLQHPQLKLKKGSLYKIRTISTLSMVQKNTLYLFI